MLTWCCRECVECRGVARKGVGRSARVICLVVVVSHPPPINQSSLAHNSYYSTSPLTKRSPSESNILQCLQLVLCCTIIIFIISSYILYIKKKKRETRNESSLTSPLTTQHSTAQHSTAQHTQYSLESSREKNK